MSDDIGIVYGSEDAARVAEPLLAAGRAHAIPSYLRYGALPEMIEAELATSAPPPAPSAQRPVAARTEADLRAALEAAVGAGSAHKVGEQRASAPLAPCERGP